MKQGLLPFVAALVLASAPALAALPIRIELDPRISLIREDVVRHLVELELRTSLSDRTPAGSSTIHVAPLAEDGRASLVKIEIDDEVTGKSVARTIDLLALRPGGANRLLALAITELLAASWAELVTNPRPMAPPLGPVASPEVRAAALATVQERGPPPRRVQVSAFGLVEGFFAGAGLLAGGGLRVVPELPRRLCLPIDLAAVHGRRSFPLGDVTIDAIHLDIGLAYRQAWSRVGLRASAGVRGGAVRFDGKPASTDVLGSSLWSPWIGPMASFSFILAPVRRLALELVVDAGYALAASGARVDGADQVYLNGAWIGASLGVGIFGGRL